MTNATTEFQGNPPDNGSQRRSGLDEPFDPRILLAVSFIQGLALYCLVDLEVLSFILLDPITYTILWTIILIIPPGILLGATITHQKRFLTGVAAFAGLAVVTAAWTGFQLWFPDKVRGGSTLPLYVVTGLVLCFKALICLQLWAARQPFTYDNFFLLTWRNLLLAALGYLFAGVVGLLLLLWGELFKLVNIEFFSDLFEKGWFIFPALTTALGLGIVIFRRLTHVIDTFSRVLRSLCFFLLPLVSAIMLMFLAVLPVQGLDTLWDTGAGTAIVLVLLGVCLAFFNATYRVNEGFDGYPDWLEKVILANLALTPIYALIALYGIWLRIDQYGLTVDRCYVLMIALLMLGLTLAYSYSIIRERLDATAFIGKVNIWFGWTVMALMLLVNSPLLDFRQMSLNSQLAAWEAGKVSDADLDLDYIARNLGRPGALALEEIQEQGSEQLASRIEGIYKDWPFRSREPKEKELTRDDLVVWHTEEPLPEGLAEAVVAEAGLSHEEEYQTTVRVHLLPLELDDKAPAEWLVIRESKYDWQSDLHIHYQEDGEWKRTSVQNPRFGDEYFDGKNKNWDIILNEATIEAVPPRWKNIKIDDQVLDVHE